MEPWEPLPTSQRLNPVAFVTIKSKMAPLKRALVIAETASDVFGIGTALVDGVVLYHYATGARALVGVP